MRVTTQMLHNSAAKAGIPIAHSLLNYINKDSDSNNQLNTLLGIGNGEADYAKKTSYDELNQKAEELEERLKRFLKKEEVSIFDKARESGSTEEICELVKKLAGNYNSTLSAGTLVSEPLNNFYFEMLKEATADNKEELEKIGILISVKDGKLSVDSEKLKSCDVDTLESILGNDGDFQKKTALIAGKIADNAGANAESFTSSYGSDGKISAYTAGKYDFIR